VPAVVALWRYPVKSMQGELLERVAVDRRGLEHDRHWSLLDRRTGFTLTARRQPELLFAAAHFEAGQPRITLPDGSTARDDSDLSEWLGHPVTLEEAGPRGGRFENPIDAEDEDGAWEQWRGPGGSFHDSTRTQVSLVSTATLGTWDVRRFRPNVVLDGGGEDELVGAACSLGTTMLQVAKQIDRCVVVTRPQPGLGRDLDVLRAVIRERRSYLGVGAVVTEPGVLAVGDPVVSPRREPPAWRGSWNG
jgi:uncharacterized protein YcbX